MGKKAALKVNLDYYYAEDDDDYWDEDDQLLPKKPQPPPPVTREPSHSSKNSQQKAETVHGIRKSASKETSRTTSSIQLYHRRPVGRPFSTLLLEHGHESLIFYLACFLGMRDISALSCVNRQLEEALSSESLYCQPSAMLLPCLEDSPLPRLSTPRLARSLALESSTLFQMRSSNFSREKTIRQIQNIQRDGHVVDSILSPSGSRITCLGDDGSIRSYRVSAEPVHSNEAPAILGTKQIVPNDCIGVIASCLSHRHCAVLSMPSTGIRRYIVSVASTADLTSNNVIAWQKDLIIPVSVRGSMLGNTGSNQEPCLKIDETRQQLVVVFRTYLFVLSLTTGEAEWEHTIEHTNWDACIIHDTFLVAIAGQKRKKQLIIYCLDRKSLVASGRLPSATNCAGETTTSTSSSTGGASTGRVASIQITVFAERIWFTYDLQLFCTGCIFRRLNRWRNTERSADHMEGVHSAALRINQFHSTMPLNAPHKPVLRQYSGLLYLANGPLIKIFAAASVQSRGPDQQPTIQPTHVLCAEGDVDCFQADCTKIICVVSTEKKQRVEVFLNPNVVVTGGKSSLFHSICIKNADVFRNRQELRDIEFRSGRLLVTALRTSQVYPYYVQSFASSQQSQLRVYDLLEI